jgi:hypothetical protein
MGCETLGFLDMYSGYHQIRMKESNQLATFIITLFNTYCYVTMLFGLNNIGVTYQQPDRRGQLLCFGEKQQLAQKITIIKFVVTTIITAIVITAIIDGPLVNTITMAYPDAINNGIPRGM